MLKKVIRSHHGEVAHDHRTVGDPIHVRIYFGDDLPLGRSITITDAIDKRLDAVRPRGGGVYDPRARTITWTIEPSFRTPYVEFDAVIAKPGVIRNRATAALGVGPPERSNTVTIEATAAPPLGWVPFSDTGSQVPRTWMKDETTTGITVRFDVPGIFVQQEVIDGVRYHRISLPGCAETIEVGRPQVPVIGEALEVPFGVDLTAEVVRAAHVELRSYTVLPAQQPPIDAEPPHPFSIDTTTYRTNARYPAVPVSITPEDIGVIRGHRVLLLKVHPATYNPVRHVLTVVTSIEVRVKYSRPAQVTGVNRRILSPPFEDLLQGTLLNYRRPERFDRVGGAGHEQQRTACDYLIITADSLYDESEPTNPVRRLAEWKARKGYRTKIVRVGDLRGGNTAAAVQTYLKSAYDAWDPPPSYVLLVGDSDLVRPAEGHDHPGDTASLPIPRLNTDLYHVTVDGSDYFPDMFVGRLPADDVPHLTEVVDKIIAYEQNPPPAPTGFYTNVSLVGLFSEAFETPPVITGQEDRPWITNLETVRDFLQGEGYAVDRIYATDTGFPGDPTAQDPRRFHDGTALTNDLLHPQFGWDGDTNRITDALDAGRFLVVYQGHGGWQGWVHPRLANHDLSGLLQNDLAPLVVSITCKTGWFDNEIDDDAHGGKPSLVESDESFAEALLCQPRAGAIGFIGMTRSSSTTKNNFLMLGAVKALWPTFRPQPHWVDYPDPPQGDQIALRRLGQISAFSKMFMARAYGPDDYRRAHFEMHHLFGDPEMPVWTSEPLALEVDHPKGVGADGVQEFVVKVADRDGDHGVCGATVVLTRDSRMVQMRQTNTNGVAVFSLASVGPGDLDLTITALGCRPYLGVLEVTAGGAELNVLDPDDGPEEQVVRVAGCGFSGSEDVEVRFGSEPPVLVTTTAVGEFGQTVPGFELRVPAGHVHGLVNVTAAGVTSQRRAVRVFHVRDKNPVDPWLYDQWNSATWSVHPGDNPTWHNPDIQLYDSSGRPVDSSNLEVGQRYSVRATVRNAAGFDAENVTVVYRWENYGAGGPWQAFAVPSVVVDAPASGTTTADNEFLPFVTGHVCVLVTLEHPEDVDLTNNSGQENLHVGYAGSPAEACFTVWNRTKTAAPVHFEVRQLFGADEQRILWESRVKHPEPQILESGDRAEACVVVDPGKADVQPGTTAEFAVTCFIGSTMIGGVNLRITRK